MEDAVSTVARRRQSWITFVASRVRVTGHHLTDCGAAILSSALLVFSFPDFGFWFLAWVGMIPLLLVIARKPSLGRTFAVGWVSGTLFFYCSCYWLTHSIINFGGFPVWAAFLLLVPGAVILGLFPAAFAIVLSGAIRLWQNKAILLAPFIWTSLEWARLEVTGQLWNAIGYSQAYQPLLIQTARWGGVYAVGFLILAVNSAMALIILNRGKKGVVLSLTVIFAVSVVTFATHATSHAEPAGNANAPELLVVAFQPNVPMEPSISSGELERLTSLHISESMKALGQFPLDVPRLVIWPESPMNFAFGTDQRFRDLLAQFTRQNHTSLLFNSMEPASGNGVFNSVVLVNEEGRAIAQYDKIRLMPFGEYVPLPGWLPGASLTTAIVGDFTPGNKYTLMPLGRLRAGVFICIEAAYPSIARTFAAEGADLLINISNDGYLGPTAVMRQHLANAIFRAVENGKPLLRVTNSGITAYITAAGKVNDETGGFQRAVRVWRVDRDSRQTTFYTRFGDVFAGLSAVLTAVVFLLTLRGIRKESRG